MMSVPDQINELSMLAEDERSVSPDFLTIIILRIDCTIRVFQSFSTWITHSCTPQKHTATITIFTSFYNTTFK